MSHAAVTLWVMGLFIFAFIAPARADVTISISDVTQMDWGTVQIPASGSEYISISPANSGISGTGTVLFGFPSRGVYSLKSSGEGETAITIDISNVSTGSSNLTIDNFTGIYSSYTINSFPSASLPLPSTSGTNLYLGARETVNAAMTPTTLTPTFDIVVIVQ